MKRLIIYLLIIATFSAPMAWAWDSHDSAFEGNTKVVLEKASNIDSDHDHETNQSDHCDHGLAHLTTLFSPVTTISYSKDNVVSRIWRSSFTTLTLAPPYRPPIL